MKYKSDILRTIHEGAIDKFAIGAISEARMREFDEMCLASDGNTTARQPVEEGETVNGKLAYETNKGIEPSVHSMEHITA